MDRWKYFGITHADHVMCNATTIEQIDELLEVAALPRGARILDIACGKAEVLCRAVERTGGTGIGVDLSPVHSEDGRTRVKARGLSDRIEIVTGDGAAYAGDLAAFDLVICLGASWIWDGHRGTLAALKRWARPGARIFVGEPCWLGHDPDPRYLKTEGFTLESFGTLWENTIAGEELGLAPLYTTLCSPADFDRYESLQWNAARRWADEHPDDPDREELLRLVASSREAYLRWGRNCLGWALHLFQAGDVP